MNERKKLIKKEGNSGGSRIIFNRGLYDGKGALLSPF